MKLVENIPLNTKIIADLISDPNDLYLVWPKAKYPFDHEQWKKVLDPEIGHAVLGSEGSVHRISKHLRGQHKARPLR